MALVPLPPPLQRVSSACVDTACMQHGSLLGHAASPAMRSSKVCLWLLPLLVTLARPQPRSFLLVLPSNDEALTAEPPSAILSSEEVSASVEREDQADPGEELTELTELQAPDKEGDLPEYVSGEDAGGQMDETISLTRDNCNLEIQVPEAEDKRVNIEFGEGRGAGAAGQCQITVRGGGDAMLALLISHVTLSGTSRFCHGEEVLRVVLSHAGVNFTFKEYCGQEEHYPVLLTEATEAFIVLSYNGTRGPRGPRQGPAGRSGFAMEAFTYHKHRAAAQNTTAQLVYPESANPDAENVYFTTLEPPQEAVALEPR